MKDTMNYYEQQQYLADYYKLYYPDPKITIVMLRGVIPMQGITIGNERDKDHNIQIYLLL